MPKNKTVYICANCGYESLRWLGKCPECNEWNTFSEELAETKKKTAAAGAKSSVKLTNLSSIQSDEKERIKTNIAEFDRVLGGGLMPGSVSLIGGDPGIGKSTLVMQVAAKIDGKVLYVAGEESEKQIKLRASRLHIQSDNIFILPETDLESILSAMRAENPVLTIVDSIQTVNSAELDNAPGSVTQIRECAARLLREAKTSDQTVILVGHVTKEGVIAGPKVLEHMVDTSLQFEGEKNHSYRILRSVKNRFGSVNEIGVFDMREEGLIEVLNPSEAFLSERGNQNSGSIVTSTIEGSRPILIEVQALVSPSNYGNPQRVATGFDYKRLSILLAVLEKRASYRLSAANVFVNIAGGVKIDEPAADLAVCCSIVSSFLDKPADNSCIAIGEVGLGGEIRSISHIEKRLQEAEKLGFKRAIIPQNAAAKLRNNGGIKIIGAENIKDALDVLFS